MPAAKPSAGATLNPSNPYGISVAWFLNEGSGTTATDAGTNHIAGTLTTTNPVWATRGLQFDDDGTQHRVLASSGLAPLAFGTGDFSIAMGYERETPDSSIGMILSLCSAYFTGLYVSIRPANFYIGFSGGWPEFPSAGAALSTGSVHNIVITCDRDGNATLYHNGSQLSQVSISAYSAVNIQPNRLAIGGISDYENFGNNWNWEGWIEYVYFASGVMSSANANALTADPYGSITSAIKTTNGLAKINVKTVNGLAIAGMKSWNGLA